MTVEADKLTLKFEPMYLEKRQMSPAAGDKAQTMMDDLGVPTGILEIQRGSTHGSTPTTELQ